MSVIKDVLRPIVYALGLKKKPVAMSKEEQWEIWKKELREAGKGFDL